MRGQDLISQNAIRKKRIPCDIYSRVVGYYQPIRYWNKGKREEFWERKTFDLVGRRFEPKQTP